jgi:hypothetical protein
MLSRNTQNYRKNSKPANMTPLCAFDGQSSAGPRHTKINDRKANCRYAKLTLKSSITSTKVGMQRLGANVDN